MKAMRKVHKGGWSAIALTATLSAGGAASPYAYAENICDNYGKAIVTQDSTTDSEGTYLVQNNVYNNATGTQCITVNNATGTFSVKSASHNASLSGPPAAYPSVYKGCHWDAGCTNVAKSGLPIQAGKILTASSSWNTVQPPKAGVYAVNYDLWFNKTPTMDGQPNHEQPNGAEVMVWLAKTGDILPTGARIARAAAIPGTNGKWDIYVGSNNGIPVLSYMRTENNDPSVCSFNLKLFVSDAIGKGFVFSDWYMVAVEAGFEIWQGGTGLASKGFSLLVE